MGLSFFLLSKISLLTLAKKEQEKIAYVYDIYIFLKKLNSSHSFVFFPSKNNLKKKNIYLKLLVDNMKISDQMSDLTLDLQTWSHDLENTLQRLGAAAQNDNQLNPLDYQDFEDVEGQGNTSSSTTTQQVLEPALHSSELP